MSGFATKSAFDAYVSYMALKKHFSDPKYDYFKYQGKVKASFDNFQTRPDAYSFNKLSAKKDSKNILLANFIVDPKLWIMDILGDEGTSRYNEWRKRTEALTYYFSQDIEKMEDNFPENFKFVSGSLPRVMELYFEQEISLETLCLVSKIADVDGYWKESMKDNIISSGLFFKVQKYRPFIEFDKPKIMSAMKNRW